MRASCRALALSCAVLMSGPAFAAEPDGPPTLVAGIEAVRITVEHHLSTIVGVRKSEQAALAEYYSMPDGQLAWVNENGFNGRAKAVMEEISKADEYGLRAGDYKLPKPRDFDLHDPATLDWLADGEIKISLAVLGYARDARGGRIDPSRLTDNLDPTLALPAPLEVLDSIAIRSDPAHYLRSFQPDQPQFERLRHILAKSKGRGSNGIGASTVRMILVNMERWRWLPQELGSYYVNVNVPEFMLRVVQDDKVVHTTRVVVGKLDKQTPIFSQDMQEVVFNPFWSVPNSIKTEELLPYLTQGGGDTSVLESHDLHIKGVGGQEMDPASIDWSRVDIRGLNIYQPPGPDNVLGNVKFVFPNKHDVYMHDTPQKLLFEQRIRAESHGCMRVQNPDQLATVLLKHDRGWTQGRVASAIATGYDMHVTLAHRIPVYITYFTIWVNDDGSLATFGDVYGHDARMVAALFRGAVAFDAPTGAIAARSSPVPPIGKRTRQTDAQSGFARFLSRGAD